MKDLQPPHDPIEALGEAYELLLEKAMDEVHKNGGKSGPDLHRTIDRVGEKVAAAGELTEEQADKLTDYVKRDLVDAASYVVETGEDFRTWFGFDVELIEQRLLELFTQAADQTTVELLALKERALNPEYKTGEITGPGTLVCDQCGERLHFHKAGRIPPCPRCDGTRFHRPPNTA